MGDLTKHFSWSEFACNDDKNTPVPVNLRANTIKYAAALEVIRYACGNESIEIISGYRTPAYNKKVGGAKNSRHKKADAGDLKHKTLTPAQLHRKISNLIDMGVIPEGGLGLYTTFVHYDIRGEKARWNG